MNSNFQVQSLDPQPFKKYFNMTSTQLKSIGAYIFESDECPCYPCRVSLRDAALGETVLAINYEHLAAESPYRSTGPIFVRENAQPASLSVNEIPDLLRHRLLSVRGYNAESRMIKADIVKGDELKLRLTEQFSDVFVQYIHVHNAGPGCFNCSVIRAN